MSTHVTELFERASILSEQERATLAGLLIESLESEVDPDVEEAWRVVDPILGNATPIAEYEPDTWGPAAAERIVAGGGGWHNPAPGNG